MGASLSLRVPVVALLAAVFAYSVAPRGAQGAEPTRSDLQVIVGHYNVDKGFSDRTFVTTWGNAYFASGLGVHAEAHGIEREETAAFFAGGLSYNASSFSLRVTAGTSTDNLAILPDFYGRVEATFRSSPSTGWVFIPSLTYRDYPNGTRETEFQGQVLKYLPLGKGTSLVLQGLARGTAVDPGDHFPPAFGAGLTYVDYRKFSVGLVAEAGRAAYDATLGPGSINERYYAIRPAAGLYLTDKIELVAQGEFTDRDSYRVLGGHVGVKFHFD